MKRLTILLIIFNSNYRMVKWILLGYKKNEIDISKLDLVNYTIKTRLGFTGEE